MATNATTLIREALTVGTVVDLAAWKLKAEAFLAPKAKTTDAVDLATMTDAQLFAHFKRTAPTEDVRFWLKGWGTMSTGLLQGFQVLLDDTIAGRVNPAEHKRRFEALKAAWRAEEERPGWPTAETWNRLARFQAARAARLAEVRRLARKVADWTEEAARIDAELAGEVAA